MKNLFAGLLTLTFAFTQLAACADSETADDDTHLADVLQTTDTAVGEEDVEAVDLSADSQTEASDTQVETEEAETDSVPSETDTDTEETEPEEPQQLPADPTEDPGQESSYYEFPAWHIPVPSEG